MLTKKKILIDEIKNKNIKNVRYMISIFSIRYDENWLTYLKRACQYCEPS